MDKRIDAIRTLLNTLGFTPDVIDAGLNALTGTATATLQSEPLLTPKQLCGRLKISSTSLWRLQPPFIKVGGRKRYDWTEVQEHLRARRGQQGGKAA